MNLQTLCLITSQNTIKHTRDKCSLSQAPDPSGYCLFSRLYPEKYDAAWTNQAEVEEQPPNGQGRHCRRHSARRPCPHDVRGSCPDHRHLRAHLAAMDKAGVGHGDPTRGSRQSATAPSSGCGDPKKVAHQPVGTAVVASTAQRERAAPMPSSMPRTSCSACP